mmetsp:Transcript_15397/g.27080  ORF Transcript_15397/g.27080 Transcript_15397/m.27080 type:complete len:606 (-) Transcript_15397:5-1822(-)
MVSSTKAIQSGLLGLVAFVGFTCWAKLAWENPATKVVVLGTGVHSSLDVKEDSYIRLRSKEKNDNGFGALKYFDQPSLSLGGESDGKLNRFTKVMHVPASLFNTAKNTRELLENVENAISPWKQGNSKPFIKVIDHGGPSGQFMHWYRYLMKRDNTNFSLGGKNGGSATSDHYWGYTCSMARSWDCLNIKGSTHKTNDIGDTLSYRKDKGPSLLKPHQRLDRIPDLRNVLGGEDKLCITLNHAVAGRKEYLKYMFQCWNYPQDKQALFQYAAMQRLDSKFVVKSMDSNTMLVGTAENLQETMNKVHGHSKIVQVYMNDPYVINSHKFDMRLYVTLVSSNPLRAYIFTRGITRFAGEEYHSNMNSRGMFATSRSRKKGGSVSEITWSFEELKEYMDFEQSGFYNHIWLELKKTVSVVLLSGEEAFSSHARNANQLPQGHQFYQLLGIDVAVDAYGVPKVNLVNGFPGQTIQSRKFADHYSKTKGLRFQDQQRMLFTKVDIKEKLLSYLEEINDDHMNNLTPREWVYLVQYMQERQNLGRFEMIYPNKALDDFHWDFIKNMEIATKARESLHRILMHIEHKHPPPPPNLDHDILAREDLVTKLTSNR